MTDWKEVEKGGPTIGGESERQRTLREWCERLDRLQADRETDKQ